MKLISFINPNRSKFTLDEQGFIELVGNLFSQPLNGQNSTEYLPSQVIAEYIKLLGFDGIEYKSAQDSEGINIALFDTNAWFAECAKTFEVTDISYTAIRDRGLVEVLGYPDEEL